MKQQPKKTFKVLVQHIKTDVYEVEAQNADEIRKLGLKGVVRHGNKLEDREADVLLSIC